VVGDLLVLLGASLYAGSNVQQELFLKRGDVRLSELLAVLGLLGSAISLLQGWALGEWARVGAFLQAQEASGGILSSGLLWYFLGFQLCMFLLYCLVAVFLRNCDAVLFNLSLLTSDVYVVFEEEKGRLNERVHEKFQGGMFAGVENISSHTATIV
jgi:solute carrier family 35 protein F1/2